MPLNYELLLRVLNIIEVMQDEVEAPSAAITDKFDVDHNIIDDVTPPYTELRGIYKKLVSLLF